MDVAGFEALLTPSGQEVLAEAAAADPGDTALLATASRLRTRYPAELVAAALTQVRLRARARLKFGAAADRMYFTQAGLEQATRATVAAHRARRFATVPEGARTFEAGCGIGADLIARACAGPPDGFSEGVELDPLTAAVARANLAAAGLTGRATVRTGDATAAGAAALAGHTALFADPARRTGSGARRTGSAAGRTGSGARRTGSAPPAGGAAARVFDPRAYSPPLDVVLDMAARVPAACVKVAPGIPYEILNETLPGGAEVEWVSDCGEVKEAALWLGRFASGGPEPARATGPGAALLRRATLLRPGRAAVTVVADPAIGPPPAGAWGRYLYEPDGAVIRAHLVAEAAAAVDGRLADPRIAYITADDLRPTPLARAYEIEDVLPFSLKSLRAELRRRGAGKVTIKKRGSAVDIERLRRDLRLDGTEEATVVLTRVGDAPVVLLCTPVTA